MLCVQAASLSCDAGTETNRKVSGEEPHAGQEAGAYTAPPQAQLCNLRAPAQNKMQSLVVKNYEKFQDSDSIKNNFNN